MKVTKAWLSDDLQSLLNTLLLYGGGVFGGGLTFAVDKTESSMSDVQYQTKLSITTEDPLPLGTVRLSWTYQWRVNNANGLFYGRIYNDTTAETIDEISSSVSRVSANLWMRGTGFAYVDILEEGIYQFSIQFKSSASNVTVYIKDVNFECFIAHLAPVTTTTTTTTT